MRRDPELIRSILLAVEQAGELVRQPSMLDYDRRTVHLHIRLLVESSYLLTIEPDRSIRQDWIFLRLSWAGYDFLDQVRDAVTWRGTKVTAEKLGSWSLETLGPVARALIVAKAEGLGIGLMR